MNALTGWIKSKSKMTQGILALVLAGVGYLQANPGQLSSLLSWLGAHPRTTGLVAPITFILALLNNPQVQKVVKEIESKIEPNSSDV